MTSHVSLKSDIGPAVPNKQMAKKPEAGLGFLPGRSCRVYGVGRQGRSLSGTYDILGNVCVCVAPSSLQVLRGAYLNSGLKTANDI